MTRFRVLLVHTVALVVVLWGLERSGARPHVLLWAVLVDYGLRLLTIEAMCRIMRGDWGPALEPVALGLSSRPEPGRRSAPITWGDHGPAAGLSAYVLVLACAVFCAFVLMYVDSSQRLDVDPATALRDALGGLLFGGLFWLESLAARSILVDPDASRPINFGYNSRELVVFALTVLTAAVVVVVRQANGYGASAWAVVAPMLVWRYLFDVRLGLQLVKRDEGSEKGEVRSTS